MEESNKPQIEEESTAKDSNTQVSSTSVKQEEITAQNHQQQNQIQNNNEEEEKAIISFPNTYCHRIRMKGSNVNITSIKCYKCFKLKAKKNFLSTIGLKTAKMVEVKYLLFFDEIYMYLMKDAIVDKNNPNIRHLGGRYNLYSFVNINFIKIEETNRFKLTIEYNVEAKGIEVFDKELYFEEAEGTELFKVLGEQLFALGILTQAPNNEEAGEENANETDKKNEESDKVQLDKDNKEEIKDEKKEDIIIEEKNKKSKEIEVVENSEVKDNLTPVSNKEVIEEDKDLIKEKGKEKEIEIPITIEPTTKEDKNEDDNDNKNDNVNVQDKEDKTNNE